MWEEYIIRAMQPQLSGEPLTAWLQDKIRSEGPVTVARFMEWALYHPQFGYYMAGPNIGPRGDFTTSPEASPAFGRLLARHVADCDRLIGSPSLFTLVECGPGKGTLANDLLDLLHSDYPDLYSRLRYYLVEISPALSALQKELLLPQHETALRWGLRLEDVPGGAEGALIANEFVDAFPVHVVENRRGLILEQYVTVNKHRDLSIMLAEASRPELLDFLDRYKINLGPGQRIEINLAMDSWLADVARTFDKGVATIIDYGDKGPERYSSARMAGTLLGYYGGAVTDKITAHPGRQDLTALVDFTALQDSASSYGLDVIAVTRQANFLLGLGLGSLETVDAAGNDLQAALQYRRGLQALISMEGLGRFHVLLVGKHVDRVKARNALSGLKYLDLS